MKVLEEGLHCWGETRAGMGELRDWGEGEEKLSDWGDTAKRVRREETEEEDGEII